ncbi:MAG: CopG family antitoxin [Candidatus Omnitrophota bacterium]
MTKNISETIPKFKNDVEAAAFWDRHDSTEYLSQTKPANLKFPKPRHKVVIGLGEKQWKALHRFASHNAIFFNRLLQQFVSEKLTENN